MITKIVARTAKQYVIFITLSEPHIDMGAPNAYVFEDSCVQLLVVVYNNI